MSVSTSKTRARQLVSNSYDPNAVWMDCQNIKNKIDLAIQDRAKLGYEFLDFKVDHNRYVLVNLRDILTSDKEDFDVRVDEHNSILHISWR